MKYSYSFDEEHYHGSFDTVEDALTEANAEAAEHNAKDCWIGERREPVEPWDTLRIDWIADTIIEQTSEHEDYWIEAAEDWLELLEGVSEKDSEESLKALLQKWFTSNYKQPNFFIIDNPDRHDLKVWKDVHHNDCGGVAMQHCWKNPETEAVITVNTIRKIDGQPYLLGNTMTCCSCGKEGSLKINEEYASGLEFISS